MKHPLFGGREWTDERLLDDMRDLERTAYLLSTERDYNQPTPRGAAKRLLRIKLLGLAGRLEELIGGD